MAKAYEPAVRRLFLMGVGSVTREEAEFITAAGRAFWTDEWLDEHENELPFGAAIENYVPHTPRAFLRQGEVFMRQVVASAEAASLHEVLSQWCDRWEPDRVPNNCITYSPSTAGWYAAMEAMGHGVGLFLFGIDVELPSADTVVAACAL